jgi:hypothetical protein
MKFDAIVLGAALLAGCHDGRATPPPSPPHQDASGPAEAGPMAASDQLTEVVVRGPAALVAEVAATSLDRIDTSSLADGTVHAVFRSSLGTDWNNTFTFSLPSSASALSLRPWLCPRVPDAVSGAMAGLRATERRLLDVDAEGHFWTSGELGDQVLSTCEYSTGDRSGGSVATFQDGPDLCTEAARSGTDVQLLNAQQQVVSRPVVCAAAFGRSRTPGYAGQIRLQLEKDADDQDGIAFTAAINHCLPAGATVPAVVSAAEMLASTCPDEGVWLQVGSGTGVQKSSSYPVSAGAWNVQAASSDRTIAHASQVDLTFASADGSVTYTIRGVVALPQLLF